MNITKAIEILSHPPFYPSTPSDKDYDTAIKLGIEALKLLSNPTDPRLIYARKLLLGETED